MLSMTLSMTYALFPIKTNLNKTEKGVLIMTYHFFSNEPNLDKKIFMSNMTYALLPIEMNQNIIEVSS